MKKLVLSLILATICGISAFAYDFSAVSSGKTLYYNITSSTFPYTVEVCGGSGLSGNLTIPSSVTYSGRTYSVTSIGGGAFLNCSGLASVTIPNSVTSIGGSAFSGCSGLTTVNFNATNCTSMGGYDDDDYNEYRYAFENCTSLSTLNIGENVTNIPADAFRGCSGLTSVTIPNSVTSIGERAFLGCSALMLVTIPSSVTSIGDYAFYGVRNIGYNGTATGSPWGALTVNGYVDGYLVYADNTKTNLTGCSSLAIEITIPNSVTSIGNDAFNGCSGLTSVTIPNSVTTIWHYAFANCSGLTEITIPESVTEIGACAFAACGLTAVNFNAANFTSSMGWHYNGEYSANPDLAAFLYCPLTTVNIGENVTSIPQYAFVNCSELTTVNFNATNCTTIIGSEGFSPFANGTSLNRVNIGANVTNVPNNLFDSSERLSVYYEGTIAQWCNITFGYSFSSYDLFINNSLVTNLVIPNPVTEIKNYTFRNCKSLRLATIPNFITSIGNYAFAGCSGLETISIGNSVTTIGDYAFYDCSGMTGALVIPNSVSSIGSRAFYDCSGFETISIGDSVTTIGDYAFYDCSGMTGALVIPNFVTSIGGGAFSGCSGLETISLGNSVESIGGYAFYGCSGLETISIGISVATIGDYAFYSCSSLTSVTIPNSVTSIGEHVFQDCSGLTTVNFNAENYTGTISNYLFESNNTLSKITIGENVTTIPNNAFKNCTSLDSIISYAANPPVIYAGTFDSQLSLNTPVVVPCGTVETYEDADFWYNFRHIQQRADCGASYTITVLSSNNAWGTVSGGGTYMAGETARLSASANEGYRFSNWSDGSTENPHNITVTQDGTYIATFVVGSSLPTIYSSFTAEACGSYTWNNQTYTESGEYQQTFAAANSADSVVTLTLTILPAPQPTISIYGELDACNPSSVALVTGQYQSYLWSNGATTIATSVIEPGYYYVEVTGENGCTGISEQTNVGVSNAITEAPQISVVGMNSMNCNVVTWSAINNDNVNAYRIYRENNVANVYEQMATVEASQATWTDETADPTARAYRYKVTAVDECGGESPMSDYHKTMHLTINKGIGNSWNLIWSHYEGFNFGTYRIYRGTSPSNMTMIGEVPSNLNSYTDNTATDNTGFYYQVEVVRNSRSRDAEISSRSNIVDNGYLPEYTITVMSANPNRGTVSGGGTYPEGTVVRIEATALEGFVFSSWSDENTDNPRYITVTENATYIASFDPATGIEESAVSEIALFPNPATDILNITSSETISEIEIVNTLGQVVKRIEVNADSVACDVEDLKAGVYVVRIHGTVVSQRKFIKE